jgi:nucleoside-diphosphate-sugar epimerase
MRRQLSCGLMSLTASVEAKGEVVNVGNTQEVSVLELAKKVKETTKCKPTIEFHPFPKILKSVAQSQAN